MISRYYISPKGRRDIAQAAAMIRTRLLLLRVMRAAKGA